MSNSVSPAALSASATSASPASAAPASARSTSTTPGNTVQSAAAPTRFSRPRFAFLVMLGVYPLITALLYLVFPLTDGWTIWQRTLVIVPAMVAAMIWGLIPGVHRLFRGFLNPAVAPRA